MKLFRTITLMLVFLTVVPVTVVGLMLIDSTSGNLKTLTWELQQERATHAGQTISHFFGGIIDDLELLISSLNVGSMGVRERQELLSFILHKRPEVNIIAFQDQNGNPLPNQLAFDSNRILPSELAEHLHQIGRTKPRTHARSRLLFSQAYHFRRAADPQVGIETRQELVVALLLRIDAGNTRYLGMEISLEPLRRMFHRLQTSAQGHLLLVDEQLSPVVSSPSPKDRKGSGPLSPTSVLAYRLRGMPRGTFRVSGSLPFKTVDGQEWLVSYSPLAAPNWMVVSLEPLGEAYESLRSMTWQVVWVVIGSLLMAMSLGVLFAFGLTRPISKLVSGALAIARGKFGTSLDIQARNEIGELAHTFNYMSGQLLHYDEQNKELFASLERGYLETIRALANSIDAKDPYTRGHSDRVTSIAVAIGNRLELKPEEIKILRYSGVLHDIGKIGIREAILGKATRLDDSEREMIQQHPVLGAKIVAPIDFLRPVQPLIRHHHEWYDGSGYPDGLSGDDIPLGARILAGADTYDAITSERPYQAAVGNQKALEIICGLRGKQLDPLVTDALVAIIEEEIALGHERPEINKGALIDSTPPA